MKELTITLRLFSVCFLLLIYSCEDPDDVTTLTISEEPSISLSPNPTNCSPTVCFEKATPSNITAVRVHYWYNCSSPTNQSFLLMKGDKLIGRLRERVLSSGYFERVFRMRYFPEFGDGYRIANAEGVTGNCRNNSYTSYTSSFKIEAGTIVDEVARVRIHDSEHVSGSVVTAGMPIEQLELTQGETIHFEAESILYSESYFNYEVRIRYPDGSIQTIFEPKQSSDDLLTSEWTSKTIAVNPAYDNLNAQIQVLHNGKVKQSYDKVLKPLEIAITTSSTPAIGTFFNVTSNALGEAPEYLLRMKYTYDNGVIEYRKIHTHSGSTTKTTQWALIGFGLVKVQLQALINGVVVSENEEILL